MVRVMWGSGNQPCRQSTVGGAEIKYQLLSARIAVFLSQPFLIVKSCPGPNVL